MKAYIQIAINSLLAICMFFMAIHLFTVRQLQFCDRWNPNILWDLSGYASVFLGVSLSLLALFSLSVAQEIYRTSALPKAGEMIYRHRYLIITSIATLVLAFLLSHKIIL